MPASGPCPPPTRAPRAVRSSLSLLCAELQGDEEPTEKRSRLQTGVYMGSAVSPHQPPPLGAMGSLALSRRPAGVPVSRRADQGRVSVRPPGSCRVTRLAGVRQERNAGAQWSQKDLRG